MVVQLKPANTDGPDRIVAKLKPVNTDGPDRIVVELNPAIQTVLIEQ